jgi:2-oxoglutarate ferredoxin oxidoreductase subunit beta
MATTTEHSLDQFLRADRMPHIWCPGCGIGTAVNCFIHAVQKTAVPLDQLAIVSGIGCTARVAGYMYLDSFHSTHGRALPLATGLKLARPELKVVVFSGDGDLFAIGGNHFIHAARRNMDLAVICVNNFNYGMTGGQLAPTTPHGARTTTTRQGNPDMPFNLPSLAAACGAVYVARWTVGHVAQLQRAMTEVLRKRGFSFLEVISPCPTLFGRLNKLGQGIDMVQAAKERTEIRNGADPKDADITMDSPIVCGKFLDVDKPTYLDRIGLTAQPVAAASE